MFPTWPAKSENLKQSGIINNKPIQQQQQEIEPKAPEAAKAYERMISEDDGFVLKNPVGAGFVVK